MSKLRKPFDFTFPLTKKSYPNFRLQKTLVANFDVEGIAYCNTNVSSIDVNEKFSVDIDFIKHEGHDIREILEVGAEFLYQDIYEAAVRHAAKLFENEPSLNCDPLRSNVNNNSPLKLQGGVHAS